MTLHMSSTCHVDCDPAASALLSTQGGDTSVFGHFSFHRFLNLGNLRKPSKTIKKLGNIKTWEQDPGQQSDPKNGGFVWMPFGGFCLDCTWLTPRIWKFVQVGASDRFSTKMCLDLQIWPFQSIQNGPGKSKRSREPHRASKGQKETRKQDLGYEEIL